MLAADLSNRLRIMKKFIRTGEVAINSPDGEDVVIKFTSFTNWSKGAYDFYLRTYDRIMTERFGADYRKLEDTKPEINTMASHAWRWAYLCSCAVDMPVEWRDMSLDDYMENIPPAVSDEIGLLAIELNPEVFNRGTETEKNDGFFSVKRSMN